MVFFAPVKMDTADIKMSDKELNNNIVLFFFKKHFKNYVTK